jgi:hypothetical protein
VPTRSARTIACLLIFRLQKPFHCEGDLHVRVLASGASIFRESRSSVCADRVPHQRDGPMRTVIAEHAIRMHAVIPAAAA